MGSSRKGYHPAFNAWGSHWHPGQSLVEGSRAASFGPQGFGSHPSDWVRIPRSGFGSHTAHPPLSLIQARILARHHHPSARGDCEGRRDAAVEGGAREIGATRRRRCEEGIAHEGRRRICPCTACHPGPRDRRGRMLITTSHHWLPLVTTDHR